MTDAARTRVKRTIYRPYGNWATNLTLQFPGAGPVESRGYIGERLDADAGLLYLNARYMDPQLGMFRQPDWWEVTEPGVGTNRYAYAGGDPVNGSDPGGNSAAAADPMGSFFSRLLSGIGNALSSTSSGASNAPNRVMANGGQPSSGAAQITRVNGAEVQMLNCGGDVCEQPFEQNHMGGGGMAQIPAGGGPRGCEITGLCVAGADPVSRRPGLSVELGKAGEASVKGAYNIGPKKPISVNGRTRIPDGLTADVLSEVKNVASQAFTRQLRDFFKFATDSGRYVHLYTRPSTTLSGPLQDAIRGGSITLRFIPE